MKIYLASRFDHAELMRTYKIYLENMYSISITSRWIHEPDEISLEERALEDFVDVFCADALLFFSEKPGDSRKGGRHVEYGIALALDKIIWVIGPKENIFHYIPQVKHYDSFEEWEYSVVKKLNKTYRI